MDGDLWEEGFACGMEGYDWVTVVAGRFLKGWERRALAVGWKAGLVEREQYERACAEAAEQRAAERERAVEEVAVAVESEIPW